jgi:WD40 repeat protein
MTNHFLLLWFAAVASALAQSPGTFTPTGNLTTPRTGHTATLLADGRVLIAGGWAAPENQGNSLSSAELYDPANGTFTVARSMTSPRRYHTATLLPDGKVLITGGTDFGNNALSSAELYDPSTGTFSPTSSMLSARSFHMASLLPSGKVLIAGGNGSGCNLCPSVFLVSAELYDPAAGTFSATGDMSTPSYEKNMSILLPDGRVFIGGPFCSEIYDPATGRFRCTGSWSEISGWPDTQTLLTNGNVLVTGGDPGAYGAEATAGIYNSALERFMPVANMNTARLLHTATLLPDGTVLIVGGQDGTAEVYDPATGSFRLTGPMNSARCCHTATLLKDGRVLIAGGNSLSAEVYRPAALIAAPLLLSLSGDGKGQGAILHSGTSQVAGPDHPAAAGEILEIYLTGLMDGSVIPPQVSIGGRMAEVLWFGSTPGFVGLNQINVRVPSGIASGPGIAVPVRSLDRPSNEVTVAVQ